MPRTLVACFVPVLAISASWLRIQRPPSVREVVLVAMLAVAPALLPRWHFRLPALATSALGVLWLAFHAEPWELLPFRDERVVDPALESVYFGFTDFYGVLLPFDPVRHPEMHSLLLVAIFGFVAGASTLIATGRPLEAGAVTAAGVGWPATLLDARASAIGVVALVAVLWILLIGRARTVGALAAGALIGSAVIVGAAWTSTATSFARSAAVDWEQWDFRGLPARALGVRFVWNAGYDGISFPPTETVVLEIEGPKRPQYWRASTLDVFTADRWIEDLEPTLVSDGQQRIPADRLVPARGRDSRTWLEQRVTVKALVDTRIVAAGTPAALDAPSLGTVFYLSGGVMRSRHSLEPRTRYRVWSAVPDPAPNELATVPATYPRAARRFLTLWGRTLPPFSLPAREKRVDALLRATRYPALRSYRPLYDTARRVTGHATSPYRAVRAIETWLKRTGGFRYDEHPPQTYDVPPLVEFATATKAGYCQHFAGAMAVMLRFLGIPARVAVGFTSGTFDGKRWKVTDHAAHAWVEAWFPRYGWVAFDPTPDRGSSSGTYSYASESALAAAALGRGERGGGASSEAHGGRGAPSGRPAGNGSDDAPTLASVLVLLGALWVLGVWMVKVTSRRRRHLTRDPRRAATASRRELEAFLLDQGVAIPASATLAWLQREVQAVIGIDAGDFASAAARARFGPPEDAKRAAETARRELRALIRSARDELAPWARARGFLSLRSLRGGPAA